MGDSRLADHRWWHGARLGVASLRRAATLRRVRSGSIGLMLIPSRAGVRLFIGALYGIGAVLGAGLLLRQLPWETYGVTWWATTVQLIGTLLTFGGLLYAWERARRFWTPLWKLRIWPQIRRLIVKPFHQTMLISGPARSTAKAHAPYVLRGMARIKPTDSVEEQLRKIQEYIETDLPQWFDAAFDQISMVSSNLRQAKTESRTAVLEAETKARKAIRDLEKRLDSAQSLDLSVAIVGLFVTAIGVFMGYWA